MEMNEATAGLFAYPVLQAADILLYQADRVPIGEDQRQHLELTRTLALRFNARYPETFQVPEPLIPPEGARIMDLHEPERKCRSPQSPQRGSIRLTDSLEVIRSKITAATTDSGREIRSTPEKPGISNLITMYSIVNGGVANRLKEYFRERPMRISKPLWQTHWLSICGHSGSGMNC